jgi:hypothetical protein
MHMFAGLLLIFWPKGKGGMAQITGDLRKILATKKEAEQSSALKSNREVKKCRNATVLLICAASWVHLYIKSVYNKCRGRSFCAYPLVVLCISG